MRWPIDVILDMLSSKMSAKDILADHPELEEEDIFASLTYARLVVSGDMIMRKIA
jgi:uncharacterized protein (DUF433 family)